MEGKITYQKIRKGYVDKYILAQRYYGVLSVVNGFGLTEREIQVIAFTAIRGNMSYANIREDFCKKYGTTGATINNIISKLKKLGIFVKENGKVKVNPRLILNFENDVVLEVRLEHTNGK